MLPRSAILLTLLAFVVSFAVQAHEFSKGELTVIHPWTRATGEMMKNGAVYMVISADGDESDQLVAVSSPIADRAELHTHLLVDGVMKMRQVSAIDVVAGSPTVLEPGGLHIMLFGLKEPLVEGKRLPLTLVFKNVGQIDIEAAVEPLSTMQAPEHKNHGS